jgi:hypothetical protein
MSLASKLSRLVDIFTGSQIGAVQGIPLSNRNYIVDGNFDWWTASGAAMTASSGSYTGPTMFLVGAGTGGAGTATAVSGFGSGSLASAVPVGMTTPVYNVCQIAQTTASTGTVAAQTSPAILQRIEWAQTLSGQSSTFSCWLWTASGTITISSLIVRQNFGTGGSPSAINVIDPSVNWTVTTTPQKFSFRIDWPSVTGKTFGTGSNSCLVLGIWLPSGVTYTLNTTQWQLEATSPQAPNNTTGTGGLPTAFEYRGIGPELARVQRYYQVMGGASVQYGAGGAWSSVLAYVMGIFPVQMRIAPTIGYSALSTYWLSTPASNQNPSSFGTSYPTIYGFQLAVAGTGMTAGQAGFLQSANSASSSLTFDARL